MTKYAVKKGHVHTHGDVTYVEGQSFHAEGLHPALSDKLETEEEATAREQLAARQEEADAKAAARQGKTDAKAAKSK